MPGVSQIIFGAMQLSPEAVQGKRVLDVGACDFNGSIRPLIESWKPAAYIGVDIIEGPSVDRVCSADDLVEVFGEESFDIVICFEMLEHSPFWKKSISNMKRVLRPGGLILLTTRSRGYPVHGFPHDYWRFELEEFKAVFSDMKIHTVESDTLNPGVFVKAERRDGFVEKDIGGMAVYSVLTGKPELAFSPAFYASWYCRRLAFKQWVKRIVQKMVLGCGRVLSRVFRLR